VIPSKSALAVVVSAAVAVTTLAVSSPAAAQAPGSAFAVFTAVCAEPAADFDAVRKAADGHGWTSSDVKADPNMPGVTIADQLTRATNADKVPLVLSAWRGTKGAVKISDCTVHISKSDFAALSGQVASWLAFPAQDSTPKRSTYRFTEAAGSHKALTPAEFDTAAAGAGLEILTVSSDTNGAVLDLMMIKK
jgi:hypothetical protein